MKIKLDEASLRKITDKLRAANTVVSNSRSEGGEKLRFNWIARMLNIYTDGVVEAMGSVDAAGNYVKIAFFDSSGKSYWKNLAPRTLEDRARKRGDQEPLKSYDELKWEFKIWKDSGDTAEAVEKFSETAAKTINFAGISQIYDDETYERAKRVEFGLPSQTGKKLPPRALFTIANQVFLDAMHKLLTTPGNPEADKLRREIIKTLFVGKAGWGGGDPKNAKPVGLGF